MKITRKHTSDFIIIILIFTLTGLTTVYVSSLITDIFGLKRWSLPYILVYIFLIIPVYHLLLLGYAFLFRRFDFFLGYIKKIKSKVLSIFTK